MSSERASLVENLTVTYRRVGPAQRDSCSSAGIADICGKIKQGLIMVVRNRKGTMPDEEEAKEGAGFDHMASVMAM